jgi:hypothetical protein
MSNFLDFNGPLPNYSSVNYLLWCGIFLGILVKPGLPTIFQKRLGYVTQGYGNILKAGSNKDPRVIWGEYSYPKNC